MQQYLFTNFILIFRVRLLTDMGFWKTPTEARGKDSKGDNYDAPNAQRIHTPRVLPKQTANGSADERGTGVKMLDEYVRTVAC